MREKIITTLRSITLSHVIAVEGLTIAALILLLSVGLAMTPPPIPGSGAVTALDFWAQRFQPLLAAIIALGAALTAYAVAKLNQRHEKEQQKAKQMEEVTKCFRRCVLAIQRVHSQTMTLGTQARNPDRTLLTPEEAASVATELQMPEWIQTEISLLPSLFARGILKYYQAAQRASRILYRFDESNVPGSTTHILFREWFVTAIITETILYSCLVNLEQGGLLELNIETSVAGLRHDVRQWTITDAEFRESCKLVPFDTADIVQSLAGDFAAV